MITVLVILSLSFPNVSTGPNRSHGSGERGSRSAYHIFYDSYRTSMDSIPTTQPSKVVDKKTTTRKKPTSQPAIPDPIVQRIEKLLNAIELVESRGNEKAIGDNGKSKGAYQIQESYWKDACEGHENLDYEKLVWDKARSRQVIKWYWERYCPEALRKGNLMILARIHNGGPDGLKKPETIKYWNIVKKYIK